jgi:predicted XRE-type DNA-binding protein
LDWYRGYDKTFLIQPWTQRTINKTFLAPNRIVAGERQHRLKMLYWIFRLGMTNNHISCPAVCPAENIAILDAIQPLQSQYPDIETVFAQQSLPISFKNETDHPMQSCWLDLFDQSAESLLYLVTETVATGRRHHLTEKTFKPIALGMPFVIVGTQGSLKYLRSYGFKTFSDVWDESYDTITDPEQRLNAIANLMKQIAEWDTITREKKLAQARAIANHNRAHFFSQRFVNQVIDELTTNLTNALVEVENTKDYQDWIDFWESLLSDPDILDYVNGMTNFIKPNLMSINNIKSIINHKLNS